MILAIEILELDLHNLLTFHLQEIEYTEIKPVRPNQSVILAGLGMPTLPYSLLSFLLEFQLTCWGLFLPDGSFKIFWGTTIIYFSDFIKVLLH